MRPAGIKGSRCLDKKGFQEKAEAPHVLIQPRNDSTGNAEEPRYSPKVPDECSPVFCDGLICGLGGRWRQMPPGSGSGRWWFDWGSLL